MCAALEHGQLPPAQCNVVPQNMNSISCPHFEIAIVGFQPAVEHFIHFDGSVPEPETDRRLLAAVASVVLDRNREGLDGQHPSAFLKSPVFLWQRPTLALQIPPCLFGVFDGLRPQIEPPPGVELAIAEQLRLSAVLAVTPKLARDPTPSLRSDQSGSPGLDTRGGGGLAFGE